MSKQILELNEFKPCTVCGEDLISDASSRFYCKLCGMPSDETRFCCDRCEDAFKTFVLKKN